MFTTNLYQYHCNSAPALSRFGVNCQTRLMWNWFAGAQVGFLSYYCNNLKWCVSVLLTANYNRCLPISLLAEVQVVFHCWSQSISTLFSVFNKYNSYLVPTEVRFGVSYHLQRILTNFMPFIVFLQNNINYEPQSLFINTRGTLLKHLVFKTGIPNIYPKPAIIPLPMRNPWPGTWINLHTH